MDHDLLNEDDFFEQLKKGKQQPAQPNKEESKEKIKKAEIEERPEEPLETDLFETGQKDEALAIEEEAPSAPGREAEEEELMPEVGAEPPLEPHPFEEESFASYEEDMFSAQTGVEKEQKEEIEQQEKQIEEQEAQQPQPPQKIYIPEDKVEDEKLPTLSKRPVIVWSVIAVTVIVVLFAGYMFFSDKGTEEKPVAQEQHPQSPQEQSPSMDPLLEKQTQYLGMIAAENNQNLGVISAISDMAGKNKVQISSLLFYGGDLSVELFGQTRDQLARALMDIKSAFGGAAIKVVASDERPGDGITSVISLKLMKKGGTADLNAKVGSLEEAKQWLSMLAQQFSLTLSSVKQLDTKPAQFNLSEQRVHFRMKGAYDNCFKFLSALGQSNRNLKVYKLVVSSLDQKSFNKSKYQLEIILDLFL
ncbi:hypothetical protein ACX8XP_14265 [Calditrichota bacterium LG25]